MNVRLSSLLDHLSGFPDEDDWQGWSVKRVGGGLNNLLYRATGHGTDFAIKFTVRDDRDRAGREYNALRALQQAGLSIAPEPVHLERDCYAQPVIVQTWLEGQVLAGAPANDSEWAALVQHYATLHSITPERTSLPLPEAVLTMHNADSGRRRFQQQLDGLPAMLRPPELQALAKAVERAAFPNWPAPRITLCRNDPNTLNMIRRHDCWASVDWENSGWGDPAFEIADLLAHPKYLGIAQARQQWIVAAYAALSADPFVATRIRVYYPLMLAWWAARLARTLHGRNQPRLAPEQPGREETRSTYHTYLQLANALLA